MRRKWVGSIFLILVLGLLGTDRSALAQGRLGDKDLERLMQNVKDDGLLPHPADARLAHGEHSIDEARPGGDEHQDEAGVASHHADEGRGTDAQRSQDHGEDAGLIDMLLGAKADGKGSAGGDQPGARVGQPHAQAEADGHGKNKDQVGAKGLTFPIEDKAVGEKRGGAGGGLG